ncbi:MAG: hypothetical protein M1818_001733 [Claussenomyces sp. TS43310]|nr:MAG: hypothetical protein M1818_001733 [Claussenomyces sp. TS43310]
MRAQQLLLVALLPLIQAQETVLGVFVFHRHGDRTSKSWPPASLTDLGYEQVYASGDFYRSRYVSNTSSSPIYGIAANNVKLSQLTVQAPADNVLQNSAQGWLQGLYPPVGQNLSTQRLGNGTEVSAPMSGYQLIPVNLVSSPASPSSSSVSENSAWLQGSSGCLNAIVSSNNYFISDDYMTTLASTNSFYQSILPAINGTFTSATDTYKNAYTIFDFVHVSEIHNSSLQGADLLTPAVLSQLQTRADQHEFNLAYNASDSIRAVAGSTLAAQVVQQLNATIAGQSASKLGAQFGAYASFLSFFALAQLPAVSVNFTGIVDYASSMVFELVTNATVSSSSYPSTSDISVRFLFSNGSAADNPLTAYPLFGQSSLEVPWPTFVTEMNKFAIGDQASWCKACGNTTGTCATATSASPSPSSTSLSSTSSSSNGSGMSKAVAGVIGAMVTLAVILGIEALILLLGGLRVVSKKALARRSTPAANGDDVVKA